MAMKGIDMAVTKAMRDTMKATMTPERKVRGLGGKPTDDRENMSDEAAWKVFQKELNRMIEIKNKKRLVKITSPNDPAIIGDIPFRFLRFLKE